MIDDAVRRKLAPRSWVRPSRRRAEAWLATLGALSVLIAVGGCYQATSDVPQGPVVEGQANETQTHDAQRQLDAQLTRAERGEETQIDLTDVVADDALIERIAALPSVEEITIGRSTVTLAALKSLAKLPKLSVLVLGETPIDDAALAELVKCQNLVRLNIPTSALSDEAIALVATLPKLELFRVISDQFTGAGFASLAPCQTLTYLIVGGEKVDDSLLRAVEPMKNVRALYLLGTDVSDEGLYTLQQARPDLHIH